MTAKDTSIFQNSKVPAWLPIPILGALTVIAVGAGIYTAQMDNRRKLLAENLMHCVDGTMPAGIRHIVIRDRVLIKDKKDRTIARIGLLPNVSHDRLTPQLRLVAKTVRTRCRIAAEAYTA